MASLAPIPISRPRRQRAQSVVEIALIMPVVLIMLLGLIDLGRAFVLGVSVQTGAREAARLGAKAALDPTITDTVIVQRLIDASNPALVGCTPASCPGWTFTITPVSGSRTSGNVLTVQAVGHPSLLAGLSVGGMSLAQIAVQGQASMELW